MTIKNSFEPWLERTFRARRGSKIIMRRRSVGGIFVLLAAGVGFTDACTPEFTSCDARRDCPDSAEAGDAGMDGGGRSLGGGGGTSGGSNASGAKTSGGGTSGGGTSGGSGTSASGGTNVSGGPNGSGAADASSGESSGAGGDEGATGGAQSSGGAIATSQGGTLATTQGGGTSTTTSGGAASGGASTTGCAKGTFKCNGAQPQVCDQSGAWQNMGTACGTCSTCDATSGTCKPRTGSCDDGNACTQTDTCQSGTCVGSNPKVCSASDQCHTAGVCDTTTGDCTNPTKGNGQTCNDGNACTQSDACQSGVCGGTALLCNSPPACKQVTTCSAGSCNYTQNFPDGSADTKCPSGKPYCSTGSCVQCTMDQHCYGATPSCDLSTHTCVCRKPSSGNLLANPGFDGSFSGWMSPEDLVADSEGCPASNSLYSGFGDEESPSQCIPITPGNYYFGGRFRGDPNRGSFIVLRFWTGSTCYSGTELDAIDYYVPLSSDWSLQFTHITVPAGTKAMKIGISGLDFYADQLYLNVNNQF